MLPKVVPWPKNEVAWGFTSSYYKLGCGLVIDDPAKWDGFKVVKNVFCLSRWR